MALLLKKQNSSLRSGSRNSAQHRINGDLRNHPVLMVVVEGRGLVEKTYVEAQAMADEASMDLVEMSVKPDGLSVCKIFNYEKYIYELKKNRKKKTVSKLKEIQITPSIASHDIAVKVKSAHGFISEGNRVKVVLSYKGREKYNKGFYGKSLAVFIDLCSGFAVPESDVKHETRNSVVILKAKP
jgi:translation initiation factor IF-3